MNTLLSIRDLFLEAIRDLRDTEARLLWALPVLAREATHPELKAAFKTQLGQTRTQTARLDRILGELGEDAAGDARDIIAKLIDWAAESIAQNDDPAVRDASLIAAAQHFEYHAIAAYGRARTYARLLGLERAEDLLHASLREAAMASVRLSDLGRHLHGLSRSFA